MGETSIRVGFVAPGDPLSPDDVSGMPHRMFALLRARGFEVVSVSPPSMGGVRRSPIRRAIAAAIPRGVRARLRARKPLPAGVVGAGQGGGDAGERVLAWSRARAREIEPLIVRERPRVLFGCCATALLAEVQTDIPFVHFSDATARLLGDGYALFKDMGPERRAAYDQLERAVLARAAGALYPSGWALRSAIDDYGLDPARGHVVPMGATVMPAPGERVEPDVPTRDALRLCIVAGDPARKRVALAAEATRVLRDRGWNAILSHVGTPDAGARDWPWVESVGRLRLSSRRDRARHRRVLRRSHVMILPSLGEAFGIAPAEAAWFGRPSVVSDAGGLPDVVRDGRTGRVVPVSGSAADFADAVLSLVSDPAAYRAASEAALERAHRVLNWEAWGDRAGEIIAAVAT